MEIGSSLELRITTQGHTELISIPVGDIARTVETLAAERDESFLSLIRAGVKAYEYRSRMRGESCPNMNTIHPISVYLLDFPSGLAGLPEYHEYVFANVSDSGYYLLQSTGHQGPRFFCLDANRLSFPILPTLREKALRALETMQGDASYYIIASTHDGYVTGNFQAPLAISLVSGKGKQLILPEKDLSTQHRLFPLR